MSKMIIFAVFLIISDQLFDGFDDEYQCPILDEDRVKAHTCTHTRPVKKTSIEKSRATGYFCILLRIFFPPSRLWMNWRTRWPRGAWLLTTTAVTSSRSAGSTSCLSFAPIIPTSITDSRAGQRRRHVDPERCFTEDLSVNKDFYMLPNKITQETPYFYVIWTASQRFFIGCTSHCKWDVLWSNLSLRKGVSVVMYCICKTIRHFLLA